MNGKFETSLSKGIGISMFFAMLIISLVLNIPAFSILVLLLPIPFGYIMIKNGINWFLVSLCWFAVAAYAIFGFSSLILPGALILAYGPACYYVFKRFNKNEALSTEEGVLTALANEFSSPWRGIFVFTVAGIVAITIFSFGFESVTGTSLLDAYTKSVGQMDLQVKKSIVQAKAAIPDGVNYKKTAAAYDQYSVTFSDMMSSMKGMLPSLIFTVSLIMSFIIYWVSRRVFKFVGLNVPKPARLSELRFPKNAVFGVFGILIMFYIAMNMGYLAKDFSLSNIIFMTFTTFSLLGGASVFRMLSKHSMGKIIGVIIITLAVTLTGNLVLGLFGLVAAVKDSFAVDMGR